MAEIIEVERRTIQQLVGRKLGLPPTQPRLYDSQKAAPFNESIILTFPVDASNYTPLQDLDTSSATFGQPYFFPDIDDPYNAGPFQPLPM